MNNQVGAEHIKQAVVSTAHGSRYLQQLCKHWAHKFETTFDPRNGRILLTIGEVRLQAEDDRLLVDLIASDEAKLTTLQGVVVSHIERFAFRETLKFDWN